jgi:hypothetical protein
MAKRGSRTNSCKETQTMQEDVTPEQDRGIKALFGQMVVNIPPEGAAVPIDVSFLPAQNGAWTAMFFLGGPQPHPGRMRVNWHLSQERAKEISRDGAGPLWDLLRDAAVSTCVEAVALGKGLPKKIGVALGDGTRLIDLDDDPALRQGIEDLARLRLQLTLARQRPVGET